MTLCSDPPLSLVWFGVSSPPGRLREGRLEIAASQGRSPQLGRGHFLESTCDLRPLSPGMGAMLKKEAARWRRIGTSKCAPPPLQETNEPPQASLGQRCLFIVKQRIVECVGAMGGGGERITA